MLDWLAQLLGLPRGLARPHRGHRVDLDGRGARRRARRCGRAGSSTRPSRRTSASRRRRGWSGSSSARCEVDDEFRMRTDFSLDDATAVVATVGTTGDDVGRPGARARATRCERGRRLAARRRRVRRLGRDLPRAPLVPRRRATAPTRSWSTRTSGSSRRWTARRSGRAARRRSTRRSRSCPTTSRRPSGAIDLKDYGPALGRRFRALKLWAVLRWYGAEGLRALIREHVRLAQLFASLVEAEPGWEIAAPHPFSTVCFRHRRRRQRRDRARPRPRRASSSSRRRGCAGRA